MANSAYRYPGRAMRLCAEIINKAAEVATRPQLTDLGGFHASMCAKFDAIIRYCRQKSLPTGAAPELIYPLVALVDETLLSAPNYRAYWTERPLQLRYFGEVIAGTKFFDKLEAHIQADNPSAQILENYFISLALGLKGMYGGEEAKRRAKITESLGATLINIHNNNKKPQEAVDEREKRIPWSILTLAVLTSVALALMVITTVIRGTAIKNAVEFLGNI